MTKVVLFLFLILIQANLLADVSINMFSGFNLKGFGDIATNYLMAREIKLKHPDWDIRFLVLKESKKQLQILIPSFDENSPIQIIDGITYYNQGLTYLPNSDFFFGFSFSSVPQKNSYALPSQFMSQLPQVKPPDPGLIYTQSKSKYYFFFDEYNGKAIDIADIFNLNKNSQTFFFETGLNSNGFYFEDSPEIITRDEIERYFRDKKAFDLKDSSIGFAYFDRESSFETYLDFVNEYARYYPQKRISIVSKILKKTYSLESNVSIVQVQSLPFSYSQSLIYHSQIPVLVTGDISLTTAINSLKIFFYETQNWKRESIDALKKHLNNLSISEENLVTIKKMLSIDANDKTFYPKGFHSNIISLLENNLDIKNYENFLLSLKKKKNLTSRIDILVSFLNKNPRLKTKQLKEELRNRGFIIKKSLLERCKSLFSKQK